MANSLKGAAYYQKKIPVPSPSSINSGYSNLKVQTMLDIFGSPRASLTDDCLPPTSAKLKAALSTVDVGPFNVYGLKVFTKKLKAAFAEIKRDKPELYALIHSQGCVCVRRVRGSSKTPSSHAFGAAIDFDIGGDLDNVGDGKVQQGMLELYPYFHKQGIYWAAEFKANREDAMHWEIADEEMRRLHAAGEI